MSSDSEFTFVPSHEEGFVPIAFVDEAWEKDKLPPDFVYIDASIDVRDDFNLELDDNQQMTDGWNDLGHDLFVSEAERELKPDANDVNTTVLSDAEHGGAFQAANNNNNNNNE